MRSALLDRRDFLRAAGIGFAAALAPRSLDLAAETDAIFATAYQKRGGSYGVAILSESGKLIRAVDLPDRGHDVSHDPISHRSVVFARQPGTFAVVFDHAGEREPVTIASVTGRHFYGHGTFSADGRLLYATENDFDNAAGVIGVYDAIDRFRRVGELQTYGVGPHEILLCPDNRTLVVANGGIETHPDYGRAELNIATMKPSLSFVDRESGDLIAKHELVPKLHQLSIRHMDIDKAGTIWFGCQHRGPASERPALIGRVRKNSDVELVDMPTPALSAFRNYVGSVAANHDAGTVAVSSPEGNVYAVIDTASGRLLASRDMVEVCGLAADRDGYLTSTGTGVISAPGAIVAVTPDIAWDNHLLRISA